MRHLLIDEKEKVVVSFGIYYRKFMSQLVKTINKGNDAVSRRAPPLINRLGVKNVKQPLSAYICRVIQMS